MKIKVVSLLEFNDREMPEEEINRVLTDHISTIADPRSPGGVKYYLMVAIEA